MGFRVWRGLVLGLALLCLESGVQAQQTTTQATPKPEPTRSLRAHPEPGTRVGDVAPSWTLPNQANKLWSSRELAGQKAMALLIVDEFLPNAPHTTTQTGLERVFAVIDSARRVEEKLRDQNVQVIVAVPAASPLMLFPPVEFPVLFDVKGDLVRAFGVSLGGLRLAEIDRAGFLRADEPIPFPAEAGPMMARFADPTPVLALGKAAPDFSFADMNGQVRRLSDLRGQKNLLLTFFPKCFTGGCANHLSSLRDERANFDAANTAIWAVSVDAADGPRGQIAFADRLGVSFPMLPDVGRNICLLYGTVADPRQMSDRISVIIDKDGIVRLVDREVHIATHGQDVLLRLRELGLIQAPTGS